MHAQSPSTTTSTTTSSPTALWNAFRWLAVALAIGIVIMATLAGQGLWNGERGLITGHGHLGNALFVLAIAQFAIAVVLFQRKAIPALPMVLTFAILVLLFAQAGLGYVGRENADARAWHIPNGVLLMGLASFMTAFAWLKPISRER